MKEMHITTDLIDVTSQAARYFNKIYLYLYCIYFITIKIIVTCFEQHGSIIRYLKLLRIIEFICKCNPLISCADSLNQKNHNAFKAVSVDVQYREQEENMMTGGSTVLLLQYTKTGKAERIFTG